MTTSAITSSFLTPGRVAKEGALASLYVRRDTSIPVVLSQTINSSQDEGYAEGVVTNTRFGSFPHSTIIDTPWGSQIRASQVDTGSRGRLRPDKQVKRRKLNETNGIDKEHGDGAGVRDAVAASSGFVHVLPPTPESWTYSLPHRTQVVYTPDYSYILLRIRARPGTRLIESGSGSGSFTHAAARAVFDGYPTVSPDTPTATSSSGQGHVFTYEYHEARHAKLRTELDMHGLSSIITPTHRDVYKDGFSLPDGTSPRASCVFLDLPAPWKAFPHLQRTPSDGSVSALDPTQAVYLCTFSPCIEQVEKSVSQLRSYGWQEIGVVEIGHKRIDVRREYTGYRFDGMRGVNTVAADVDEALDKLREVEQRTRDFQNIPSIADGRGEDATENKEGDSHTVTKMVKEVSIGNKQQDAAKSLFREGVLVHQPEPELKTHTSYLVFAVLPRDWTEEDENREREKWGKFVKLDVDVPKSQRQLKKEAKGKKKNP
ncbi:hypothetical protein DV736_g1540, partial [Chaetothyriales sp. CBS 134916]